MPYSVVLYAHIPVLAKAIGAVTCRVMENPGNGIEEMNANSKMEQELDQGSIRNLLSD